MSPPNILIVMADQLAAPFLGVYGHTVNGVPRVKTPNIDALAERGVVFENAYSNSPLCAPARFTMMSGRRSSRIGAYDNAAEFAASVPTYAHHLRNRGYATCLSGKMHFVGPDQLHGFEQRLTTDIYPADFGWTPNWLDPQGRFDWWFHNMDSVVNAGIAEATNQLDFDDDVGYHAVRKLRDLARTTDPRPWCLTVSFTHPHDPYVMRQAFWNLYDHDAIDLPAIPPIADAELDPHSRRLRRVSAMDQYDLTDAQIRNARHAYYAAISYVDDWIGQLLETLTITAMADDTIVIFTSDHGDMLGERGLWYKMSFFEHACRIPMIVSAPGRFAARRVVEPVGLMDVLPTLVDLADASAASVEGIDGTSMIPLLHGERQPERTVVGEYLGEGAIAPIFMIRRGRHKYIQCDADPPQLFDLVADPSESVNLAGNPASGDLLAAFSKEASAIWDSERINAEVLASQSQRRTVAAALRTGDFVSWDFEPRSDAANRYMRNHLDLNEVESGRRLRRVSPTA